jgi:hypothetical protein
MPDRPRCTRPNSSSSTHEQLQPSSRLWSTARPNSSSGPTHRPRSNPDRMDPTPIWPASPDQLSLYLQSRSGFASPTHPRSSSAQSVWSVGPSPFYHQSPSIGLIRCRQQRWRRFNSRRHRSIQAASRERAAGTAIVTGTPVGTVLGTTTTRPHPQVNLPFSTVVASVVRFHPPIGMPSFVAIASTTTGSNAVVVAAASAPASIAMGTAATSCLHPPTGTVMCAAATSCLHPPADLPLSATVISALAGTAATPFDLVTTLVATLLRPTMQATVDLQRCGRCGCHCRPPTPLIAPIAMATVAVVAATATAALVVLCRVVVSLHRRPITTRVALTGRRSSCPWEKLCIGRPSTTRT